MHNKIHSITRHLQQLTKTNFRDVRDGALLMEQLIKNTYKHIYNSRQ